jgi:uncharacterized membrane protein YdjX (TVP38/TMEM64 family)
VHRGRGFILRRFYRSLRGWPFTGGCAWKGVKVSRDLIKKLLLVAAIAGVVVAFWAFNLGHYFTLSYVKGSADTLKSVYTQHPALVIAVYFLVYVLTTSLSLPGAAVLTLAGGALFGLAVGTLVVSFASSIGATLACFVSRSVLRDWVQRKFGDKTVKLNEGIKKEGAFYLFTLRLIPVFPFWMINLVMGLTSIPLRQFYWVSQLGMLAGTIVYVNAGKELAQVESLKGILSPGLLVSFALIGIFPIAAKKLVALYRNRRGTAGSE